MIHSALDCDYMLDIAGGGSANGANIQLYKGNQTAAQMFFAFESNPVVDSLGQSVADGVYFINQTVRRLMLKEPPPNRAHLFSPMQRTIP